MKPSIIAAANAQSNFPPSFDDSPWSYGFALFSLTTICAVSLSMLWQFWFEARARRLAAKMAMNLVAEPVPFASPLTVHRLIIAGFLLTILCGALPDVLVLFFWREASTGTMETLFTIDRIGDGLTLLPFLLSAVLSAWGIQVIPQQLLRETRVTLRRPGWDTVRDKLKIVAVVLIISAGVTLAKASA